MSDCQAFRYPIGENMKIKALLLLPMLIALSLILVACHGSSTASNGTTNTTSAASLSEVNMLLVGTLKLDGTDQALTADEASQLLPLWQAYRSLSISQTAAEEEVNGLLKQIQNTMTTQQLDAIKAMNLTSTDMMQMMQSLGDIGPQGTPNPNATPGADSSNGIFTQGIFSPDMQPPSSSNGGSTNGRPSGNGPMPGGGGVVIQGGPGMGGDVSSATGLGGGQVLQGTPNPTQQARFITQASQVNTMLLNVLISKLEALTNP
jgi:hypothetical protein